MVLDQLDSVSIYDKNFCKDTKSIKDKLGGKKEIPPNLH